MATIASGTHQADPAQEAAAARLDDLHVWITEIRGQRAAPTGMFSRLWWQVSRFAARGPLPHKRAAGTKGLYLWGSVGRGKTWLMDLFHDSLPGVRKRRVHFHRFMREVHRSLKAMGGTRDPLQRIATDTARDIDVLCFDELFVSDIADAMILGTLFQHLFERGVTIVATSNLPPSQLYKDGLQRARFLPAIAALEENMEVFELTPGTDFRLRALEQAALFHHPAGAAADRTLEQDFRNIAGTAGEADCAIDVDGRKIKTRRCADGVVWFSFEALCDGPRGPGDYIELAKTFHTVLVSGVPAMDETMDNQARRFVTLVDEFYDRNVKLILSSDAPLTALYRGERLHFEFQRTTSRLQEMQSHDYLAQPHLG